MDIRNFDKLSPEQAHLVLGWAILEYKLIYFYPTRVHRSWHEVLTIDDNLYDFIYSSYQKIGNLHNIVNSAHTVGFPSKTAKGKIVWRKLHHNMNDRSKHSFSAVLTYNNGPARILSKHQLSRFY